MVSSNAFSVSVVTPEQAVIDRDDARQVVLPAHDGDLGVLRGHAPILLRLGIGALRVETVDGESETLYVESGFAQMVDNRLTVLTEHAKNPADVDPTAAEEAWSAVRGGTLVDEHAYRKHQDAQQRAVVQRRMANKA